MGPAFGVRSRDTGDEVKSINSRREKEKDRVKKRKKSFQSTTSSTPSVSFSLTLCRKSLKSKPIKLCQIYRIQVLCRDIKYWPPILIRQRDQHFTGPPRPPLEFREFTEVINCLVVGFQPNCFRFLLNMSHKKKGQPVF